jgi:hypothetical protein
MPYKIKFEKESLAIIFKLLVDALFIMGGFLLVTVIAETLIPGISIPHSAYTKILFLIAIDLSAIYLVSPNVEKTPASADKKTEFQKTTFSLLAFLVFLAIISLWKLNIILDLIFLLLAVMAGILIYKAISEED